MSRTPTEELKSFLSDMYSIELQALVQMKSAPEMAGKPSFAKEFERHYVETERHADLMKKQLEKYDASHSSLKDMVMKLGGKGFLLFAGMLNQTPGRLAAHSYSYEAMEWAGYTVLAHLAENAGDIDAATVAREIQGEERAMMKRIERDFDTAEEASHGGTPASEMKDQICKHLAEAHAIERQSLELLDRAPESVKDGPLSALCERHKQETLGHIAALERRLAELDSGPSHFEDISLKMGAVNWHLFFKSQEDDSIKLAAFLYAVEHLEIASYELLKRSAVRANDAETEKVCRDILEEEKAFSFKIADQLDTIVGR